MTSTTIPTDIIARAELLAAQCRDAGWAEARAWTKVAGKARVYLLGRKADADVYIELPADEGEIAAPDDLYSGCALRVFSKKQYKQGVIFDQMRAALSLSALEGKIASPMLAEIGREIRAQDEANMAATEEDDAEG